MTLRLHNNYLHPIVECTYRNHMTLRLHNSYLHAIVECRARIHIAKSLRTFEMNTLSA